ncbi:putative cytochrome P450 oxidoreductase [Aspergillus steynii IBT 23096]|uniref:Putative cytochrome P450 oxidoreductase n=1 Tax=Aspergillus steynii IBT 23096 TaxID=1392250 RepID=A0A2I2GAE1_9EURO|nr:putative cytochrome P450 oxidoreductase [Aspergillus steynii IBT 23096]PLB49844.1 putative cytochrome P450 oxidoreductase [Aspergillus steynii IBT 23096]
MENKLTITLFLLGLILFKLLRNRLRLSGIPGPWLAAYTRLWKLHNVWQGQHHHTALALHRRYGHLVRIGPDHISVSDPKAIPIIYSVNKSFTKTAFYPIQCISWNQKPQMNLFSTRDERFHRNQKRPVAGAFSMTAMLEIEPAVDSCTEIFLAQIRKTIDAQKPFDLGIWLQYYAFDVVGEMCFAQKLGFLEQGQDVDSMIQAISFMIQYAAVCGQIPEAHNFLLGNPLFPLLMPQMELWNQVLVFTLKAINNRGSLQRNGEMIKTNTQERGKDMMSRWMAMHEADPEKLSTRDLIVHLSTNVFAGSDTTAVALRAILYYLICHPDAMTKAQTEIDRADQAGQLSDPISYQESVQYLPYFGAVMKEAMRLHPSIGMTMERRVPDEGVYLAGTYIPGGTTVGINPWVVQRDPDAFPQPDAFRPERWLDSSPEKLQEMEKAFFNFGAGSRSCVGKAISLMEMHKIVPQLLRSFDFYLHKGKPWKVRNVWFLQQEDFICDIVPRKRHL